ncbi:MAG: hypothetical protein AAFQ82_01335 [Myxococcota bacterium]
MRQLGWWTLWAVGSIGIAPVAYAAPPVEVEVIVGESDDDALFSEAEESTDHSEPESQKDQNKVDVKSDGKPNVNTQVVNLTINNDGSSEREKEMKALEQDMADARSRLNAPPAPPAPTPPPAPPVEVPAPPAPPSAALDGHDSDVDAELHERRKKKRRKSRKGRKDGGFRAGDSLAFYRAGDLRAGFGLEHMVADRLSFTLSGGWLSAKEDDDGDQRASDRFLPSAAQDRTRGFLLEGGMNLHVVAREHWNVYGSVGLSNVNYSVDGSERLRGGSVYGRLGTGIRWIWSRLHLGFDLGWYPYEITRYQDNGPEAEGEVIELADAERVDSNRVLATWYVGWRF